jgi:hypothetical protein
LNVEYFPPVPIVMAPEGGELYASASRAFPKRTSAGTKRKAMVTANEMRVLAAYVDDLILLRLCGSRVRSTEPGGRKVMRHLRSASGPVQAVCGPAFMVVMSTTSSTDKVWKRSCNSKTMNQADLCGPLGHVFCPRGATWKMRTTPVKLVTGSPILLVKRSERSFVGKEFCRGRRLRDGSAV